ncbi:putative bifunctional diguanylate cyclase/phosphodiesterase [Kineococcus sp. SYSU DK001]|uniref:putative bifunctional diguanylate cyclase/phosphodiesterase n=1 Tax=Kineococcus sp. SYSU DK001 TaxID=3383122 RepID=UPI003D7CA0BF
MRQPGRVKSAPGSAETTYVLPALTPTRPTAGRVAGGAAVLALAAGLTALAGRGPGTVDGPVVVVGVVSLLLTAVALVALRPGRDGGKHFLAATAWGAGTLAAGLFPHAQLGPFPFAPLAFAAAELGALVVLLLVLVRARAGGDDPPLVVDALMLGSALATAGWDALARTGHHGPPGWTAATLTVLVVASVVACSAIALAVEHPRLRVAAAGLTLNGLGTALAAVCLGHQPAVAWVAVAVAAVGGAVGLLALPRDGVTRHGGQAAERAARRLETASLVPGPILLVDLAFLVVDPRADSVLYGLYITVLVTFTVRHAATARSIDRTTAHLTSQALHDDLTGLGNRALLERALTGPERAGSLVLVELGGLDDVNDVLGVGAGDAVIRAAARAVAAVADGCGGHAFRPSGDELAVVLPGDPAQCLRAAEALIAAVAAAPRQVDGAARFPMPAVAGVAAVPAGDAHDGADVMKPFVHADIALRDARRAGRGAVSVYSGTVAAEHARRSLLRDRLAAAIAGGCVDVHYQPVVSFTTGRVEKFEALARWDDPVLGRISPVEFIAVAEESNLVVALGEHVLRRAVESAHEAGVFARGTGLAVNVSVVQLQSPGFTDVVVDLLQRNDIPPHLLTLEVTESVFLDEDSPAERVVTELAGLGCRIAIDDFGTGYSAFGYLGRLPVHVLKIDRSLTQSLTDDVNGQSIVTCVVDLANRLGLTVVVEGVETDQQAAICRFISAPLGQGWLYSAAVPRERLEEELVRVHPVPEPLVGGGEPPLRVGSGAA